MLISYYFLLQITVNNKPVSPAYQNGDFRIATTGIDTVLVIPKIHAKITFSGLIFSIYLPYNEFSGNTEGQCGESSRKNVFIYQTFSISWLVFYLVFTADRLNLPHSSYNMINFETINHVKLLNSINDGNFFRHMWQQPVWWLHVAQWQNWSFMS